jgi:hypothetical protein
MRANELNMPPRNLARVALFTGNLEQAIAKFSPDFFKKPSHPNIEVYGLLHPKPEPYIINIAYQKELKPNKDYNTLLAITSRSNQRNLQLVQQLQETTEIDFQRTAPEGTELHFETYRLMLELLGRKPEEIMNVLAQLVKKQF